jgi:hypothetical protein
MAVEVNSLLPNFRLLITTNSQWLSGEGVENHIVMGCKVTDNDISGFEALEAVEISNGQVVIPLYIVELKKSGFIYFIYRESCP